MDLGKMIADLLERDGITQKALADRIGVDQATISRELKRPRSQRARRTAAYTRLSDYMQQYAIEAPDLADPVLDAVRATWDGSEEHAAALAKLILTSRELWPTLGKETPP